MCLDMSKIEQAQAPVKDLIGAGAELGNRAVYNLSQQNLLKRNLPGYCWIMEYYAVV